MKKNVSNQKLAVYAYDSSADGPKTGNSSSIFGYISLNGGSSNFTNDQNPSEINSSQMPGLYIFDLLKAETNADLVILSALSQTANVKIDPVIVYTEDVPANFGSMSIDSTYGYVKSDVWQFETTFFELVEAVDANLITIKGNTTPVDNLEDDYDGTGYDKSTSTIGTATSVTNEVDADITAISGDATAAINAEAFFDNTGFNASNSTLGTVINTLHVVSVVDVNVVSIYGYMLNQNGYIGENFDTFFSVFPLSTKTVNDIGTSDLTQQNVRDAMKLSPTVGSPSSGSVDEHLDDILTDTANMETSVTNSLNTYDPPTRTELTSDKNEIISEIDGVSSGSAAEVWGYTSRALTGTVNANITQISSDSVAADNAEAFFDNSGFNASNSRIALTQSNVEDISNLSAANVWGYVSRSLTGTPNVNVSQISGDSVAADNAEAFFDNSGFNASASTIGTVTNLTEEITISSDLTAAEVWGYTSRTLSGGSISDVYTDTQDIKKIIQAQTRG